MFFFPVECHSFPTWNTQTSDVVEVLNSSRVYKYQDQVLFSCMQGYELQNGLSNGTIECLANGSWSDESGCEPGNFLYDSLTSWIYIYLPLFTILWSWECRCCIHCLLRRCEGTPALLLLYIIICFGWIVHSCSSSYTSAWSVPLAPWLGCLYFCELWWASYKWRFFQDRPATSWEHNVCIQWFDIRQMQHWFPTHWRHSKQFNQMWWEGWMETRLPLPYW